MDTTEKERGKLFNVGKFLWGFISDSYVVFLRFDGVYYKQAQGYARIDFGCAFKM